MWGLGGSRRGLPPRSDVVVLRLQKYIQTAGQARSRNGIQCPTDIASLMNCRPKNPYHHRMKRWSLRILMCVVLGVVTTVGVAWGLGWLNGKLWPIPGTFHGWGERLILASEEDAYIRKQGERVARLIPPEFDANELSIRRFPRFGYDYSWIAAFMFRDTKSGEFWDGGVRTERWGWPCYATHSTWLSWSLLTNDEERRSDYQSVIAGSFSFDGVDLGWRPLFPGFIINTLFYAAMWFTLLFGWRAHLRQVRKWQGYCPMCKCDLRGDFNNGCPECGVGRES